jgi:hypothetical protein
MRLIGRNSGSAKCKAVTQHEEEILKVYILRHNLEK